MHLVFGSRDAGKPCILCGFGGHWVRLVKRAEARFVRALARGRVEERRGIRPKELGCPFPFPAHQTGRADFQHPAFRQTSYEAHAGRSPGQSVYAEPSEDLPG
jgi:hypothetical protein